MNYLKNDKLKSIFLLVIIGLLTVVSCFSLSGLAQSSIDNQKGRVFTEAVPSRDIIMGEIANNDNEDLPATYTEIKLPAKMSLEQAEPFIQAATEALKGVNVSLPPEEYMVEGSYYSESGVVSINYLPADWKDLSPINSGVSGKAYFVSFNNVDINTGTGTIVGIRTVDGIDLSEEYNNSFTIKFKNLK